MAARAGQSEVVRYLVQSGATVEAKAKVTQAHTHAHAHTLEQTAKFRLLHLIYWS